MAQTDIATKPVFSATNVIIIVGFVVSIITNWFLFKMQVQEIMLNGKADNRVYEMRFSQIERRIDINDLIIKALNTQIGQFIEAKRLEFENVNNKNKR